MRATTKLLGLAGLLVLTAAAACVGDRACNPSGRSRDLCFRTRNAFRRVGDAAADEIRLTIRMNQRSFGFLAKQEPLARRTMVFETTDHAPTDEMRAAVAELAPLLQARPTTRLSMVTAYAADPTVAYRRARAVRGELIERPPDRRARLVAAAGPRPAMSAARPSSTCTRSIPPAARAAARRRSGPSLSTAARRGS